MRVIVGTDIEGVAGVVSFENQAYATGVYYEEARSLLTAEINAAVDGLVEIGVDDILVMDGHGPGGVKFSELHPAAKLLHGRPLSPRKARSKIIETYDAAIMIGQHSMAGIGHGTLNHTQSSRTVEGYTLNGVPIGEIAQFALYHGAMGVPLIFLSGDDAACEEAQDCVEGIVTVAVKKGLSRTSAISLSREMSHRLIREGVQTAVERQREQPIAPLRWEGPFVLEKRFLFTEIADSTESNPLYERVDAKTVRLRSDDILQIVYA